MISPSRRITKYYYQIIALVFITLIGASIFLPNSLGAQSTQFDYGGVVPGGTLRRTIDAWGKGDFCASCHNLAYPLPPEPPLATEVLFSLGPMSNEPGLKRLTDSPGRDISAKYSPKGDKIVWVTDNLGNWTIWVMDEDGTNKKQLTSTDMINGWPSWSPDGQELTYWAWDFTSKTCDIWKMNSDGTSKMKLTTDGAIKGAPTWSPRGDRIAYTSNNTGNMEAYVMNIDGSGNRQLTKNHNPGYWVESRTTWNPDGVRLYYQVTTFPLPEHTIPSIRGDVAFVEIFSLNVDTGQEINITPKLHENVRSVSPDGKKLACISLRSNNYGLWVMNDDGTNQIQLTPHTYGDRAPEFSPDGKRIVFWGIFEIQPDIFIIDVDGSHLTRLTESHYQDVYPSWSPDGTKIIFESEREGNFDIWQIFLDAPIIVNANFEKSAVPGETNNATIVIQNTGNDTVQIDEIGLRFDSKKEHEILIPISSKKDLTHFKETFKEIIPFPVQKNAKLGYHYYDVIVQYSINAKGSQQSRTYEHTARDLKVGNLEEARAQTLYHELNTELNQRHATAINKSISLGTTTSEVAIPLKGYFDYLLNPNAKPFVEANDEFYKAKHLYQAENYTGATTHLQKVEQLITEQPSVTETSKTPNNMLMIVAILPIALLLVLLVFHTRKKGKNTSNSKD